MDETFRTLNVILISSRLQTAKFNNLSSNLNFSHFEVLFVYFGCLVIEPLSYCLLLFGLGMVFFCVFNSCIWSLLLAYAYSLETVFGHLIHRFFTVAMNEIYSHMYRRRFRFKVLLSIHSNSVSLLCSFDSDLFAIAKISQ